MPRHSSRTDKGSALVMVLVLMIVLSIALGSLFGNADANFGTSVVVSDQEKTFYATDGGVEFVIRQLQLRPDPPMGCPQLSSPSLNGRPVALSCATTSRPDTFVITATVLSPYPLGETDARVTMETGPDRRVHIDSWVIIRP